MNALSPWLNSDSDWIGMLQMAQQAYAQQMAQKKKGGGMGGGKSPESAAPGPDPGILKNLGRIFSSTPEQDSQFAIHGTPPSANSPVNSGVQFQDPNAGSMNWFDVPMGSFEGIV
jgi:hypothetical protein